MRKFGWVAVLSACYAVKALAGPDGVPDDKLQFTNTSSYEATVFVDGGQVCTVAPGESCSVQLWANDSSQNAETKHPVHITSQAGSYDDPAGGVSVTECHWNWIGLSTYTITDNGVQFTCAK